MPALNGPPALILVTGANGYVGTWIVQHLLKLGYSVRAAVRTAERGQYLQRIFREYGDKLEIIAIGDIVDVQRLRSSIVLYSLMDLINVGECLQRSGPECGWCDPHSVACHYSRGPSKWFVVHPTSYQKHKISIMRAKADCY